MKQHYSTFLLCISLGVPGLLAAQNWVNGGNTLSANGTLGTNSGHSLLFETSGVERGRITNGGNWAIGSTGTTSRFTVNTPTNVSPFRAQVNGGTKLIVGTNGGVSIGTPNAGPANGLYVIGNVGVGVANPTYKLQVNGSIYGVTLNATTISATNIYGQYISGSTGVAGYSSSSSGVSGQSSSGYGTQGYSSGSIGVFGQSGASFSAGVYGTSPYIGVQGVSSGTDGGRQAIRGENGGSATGYAGFFNGNVWVYGTLIKNAGTFKIDHPLDPANKFLNHSFVESPDMKNIYDGVVTTDESGHATVILPDYFEALNRDFRYQLTTVGKFADAIISKEIRNNRFEIQTSRKNVTVSWQVTGIRKDAYAESHPIRVEEPKKGDEIGKYIFPEGFGKTEAHRLAIAKPSAASALALSSSPGDDNQRMIAKMDNETQPDEYTPSDFRFKQNITDLEAGLTVINKLRPKEYEFRQEERLKRMHLPQGKQYGLIAQDLEQVVPALVKETDFRTGGPIPAGAMPLNADGLPQAAPGETQEVLTFKSVNYTELIPILIKGMQELDSARRSEIAMLKSEMEELKALIRQLDGQTSTGTGAWMRQNAPNPVRTSTTIEYFVPGNYRSARILITNAKGEQLKIFNVTGKGMLNVAVGNLPSGTYTYSLVADGNTISSKKLVIAR